MNFILKEHVITSFKTNKIYVATTHIVSNKSTYYASPKSLTIYFLVFEKEQKYYEIFSNTEIKFDNDNIKEFNTPYISKVEPLYNYLKDYTKRNISSDILFDFIISLNIDSII